MKTFMKIFLSRMIPVVIGFLISAYLTILYANLAEPIQFICD